MVWSASRRAVTLVAVIAVLLPLLAVLQYRWLGELSGLEQLRARQNLEAATVRLSTEFDGRLATVYGALTTIDLGQAEGPKTGIASAFKSGVLAGFVKKILVVDRSAAGKLSVHEFDPSGREIISGALPAWLTTVDANAEASGHIPAAINRTLIDEPPAIVARPVRSVGQQWIVALLDMETLASEVIPTMLAGCFEGGIPTALDVLIVRDDHRDLVVYESRPDLARADFHASVPDIPLFAIHGHDLDVATAQRLMPDAGAHRWRVYLQHQPGALEATLGVVRTRNLAIGIGVLFLLALSVGLLVLSMHRMQRAAREQLELVARISHELRTPLATITCAGENLADDVVGTPADTRHYGELIKREGRRLTKTIGDILLCCRLQARPDVVLNRQPIDVTEVINDAIAESRAVAPPDQRISVVIDPALPDVLADRDALKMALKNLVINAVKYGRGGLVTISATATGGSDVSITVEDEGPGIPRDERRRIFEPFYRGHLAKEMESEGSGIGLSIVRQVARSHGGRIRVANGEACGARFVLQLPAIKPGSRSPVVEPAA